jgi:hypothetical protein
VLGDIKRYELGFFAGLAIVGLGFWLFRLLTKKRTN